MKHFHGPDATDSKWGEICIFLCIYLRTCVNIKSEVSMKLPILLQNQTKAQKAYTRELVKKALKAYKKMKPSINSILEAAQEAGD